jgi:Zn finger protein HypA/HybF involved in hydrogenase expression
VAGGLLLFVGVRVAAQQQTTRNPHGKLQEECAVCHSSEGWVPAHVSAAFDHSKKGFALVGAHAQTACRSCHASLDFHGASQDCASCHKDVHHGELGADCGRCHTPRNFIDRSAMVRAHQLTRFPLSGAHLTVDCADCHTPSAQGQLTFVNVGVQCVECHLAQYQAAKNPDHVASGFPEDCGQCHAPTVWASARFNHDATGFSLTGMHRPLACQQCHTTGTFTALSTACVSCHQQDYNGTTNPGHSAAAFPTTCETCHTTAGWTGASFNHTWFPVPHRTATQCADCHTNTSNYTQFVCTTCHTQATTDPHHSGVRGYVWNSTNCYACHRNGGGG